MADKDPIQVVSVVARDSRGWVLFGQRNDNGKWTLPGGHLEEGERPVRGAIRELLEETGLKPQKKISELCDRVIRDGQLRVIVFECEAVGTPTGENDPDEECDTWKWLDVNDKEAMEDVLNNLHSPENVALQAIGVQKTDDGSGCEACGAEPGCNIDCDHCSSLAKALLPKIAMGGMLAFGSAHASPSADSQPSTFTPKPAHKDWSPDGLTPELHPIAHMESSFGQHMTHNAHSKGAFHTAVGAVGLKPVTAHEEYTRSPELQAAFPGLHNPDDFSQRLSSDHQLYNRVASSHWERLKKRFGTPERAAFAWRWGWGNAAKADEAKIAQDPYVQRFQALSAAPVKKQKEVALGKSEDEISRLMNHPNPIERRLALKMAGVQPQHLCQLAQDPAGVNAALSHGAADSSVLHEAIDSPKTAPWEKIIQHRAFDTEHAQKIAQHILGGRAPESVAQLLAASPYTGPDTIQMLVPHVSADTAAHLLLHPSATEDDYRSFWTPYVHGAIPAPELDGVVGKAFLDHRMPADLLERLANQSSSNSSIKPFADAAYRHPKVALPLLDRLISRVLLRPDFDGALLEAIKNPALSPQQHDMLLRARNPVVRGLAIQAGAGVLEKAFDGKDFKALTSRSFLYPKGEAPIDHRVLANSHPPGIEHLRQHFLEHQQAEKVHVADYRSRLPGEKQTSESESKDGISPKLQYKTKDAQGNDRNFLIKPFHEEASEAMKSGYPHPTAGWAELTSQALYHAGGIGHLHGKSHVVEHEGYPAIAVHFDHGVQPASKLDWEDQQNPTPESTKHDIRHIAVMDYLTGNYDRHANNLMASPDRKKVLAIDHGLAFQYKIPETLARTGDTPKESFNEVYHSQSLPHFTGDNETSYGPVSGDTHPQLLSPTDLFASHREKADKNFAPALSWWKKNSLAVRSKFDEHLGAIKDPELRDHIHQNFHARASVLDRAARGIEPTFLGRNVHWSDVQHPMKGLHGQPKQADPTKLTPEAQMASDTKTTNQRAKPLSSDAATAPVRRNG